jgi:hypothetical protein
MLSSPELCVVFDIKRISFQPLCLVSGTKYVGEFRMLGSGQHPQAEHRNILTVEAPEHADWDGTMTRQQTVRSSAGLIQTVRRTMGF